MKVYESCVAVLTDLKDAIEQLHSKQYRQRIELLYNASVGQHCRHIIEFFQCLSAQYRSGKICYDLRQRNILIEESTDIASDAIEDIMNWLSTIPQDVHLQLLVNHELNEAENHAAIQSSLVRELVFNIEHAIHHMAIIKIGLKLADPDLKLPEHFGVAPSTIRYNQSQQVNA